jgi:hypothetical protein
VRLTFKNEELRPFLADAERCWPVGIKTLYDEVTGKGFWLVGDQGVYLMHNGQTPEGGKNHVVYAVECNPEKVAFDEWWDVKRATFGGDDGVDFLSSDGLAEAIGKGWDIEIDFSDHEAMTVYTVAPRN